MEPLILKSKGKVHQTLLFGLRSAEGGSEEHFEFSGVHPYWQIHISWLSKQSERLQLWTWGQNVWHWTLKREPKAWLESDTMQEQVICFDIYENWQKSKSCCFWSVFLFFMMYSFFAIISKLDVLHPWVYFLHGGDGIPLVPLLTLIHLTISSLDEKCNKKHRIPAHCRPNASMHWVLLIISRQIKLLASVKI